jgi:hypothetical protein
MVAFRCYSGRDSWRAAIPAEFDDEVDTAVEVLQQRRSLGDERYFKELRGKCEGLTEVRVDFELELDDPRSRSVLGRRAGSRRPRRPQIHIRILGFGTADDFVLLYGFQKRGGSDYGPACRSAHNRRRGVIHDGRRATPCRFPQDQ